MAIHAQRTAFRSSSYIPNIKIQGGTPSNQDILIWSASEQAFVNGNISCILPPGSGGSGSGSIINGNNLGTGAEIFSGLSSTNTIMDFRSISGVDGISVGEDTVSLGEITISNDIITNAQISVPDGFQLIIDNDNTTYDSAIFTIYSNYSQGNINLTPVTYSAPAFDITIITDPTFTNNGQIVTASGDFIAAGFEAGMCLLVDGTNEQDGLWEIESVTQQNITITVPFTDATDAGLQPATTLSGLFFKFLTNNSLQIFNQDLSTYGFVNGQEFTLSGSTDNDGVYTIDSVSNDTIVINETFPGTLGCDVNNISIITTPGVFPVGWSVNEQGQMITNNVIINGDLDVSDNISIQGYDLSDYIELFVPDFPENGLITQLTDGVFVGREIEVGNGLTINNPDGIVGNPTINVDDFTISLGGELQGNVTISGLSDGIINASLVNLPQFAGLAGNSYNRVTIDGAGRVTFGVNQPIVGVNGINVNNATGVSAPPVVSANDFSITLNGDVFGSGTVVGLNNVAIQTHLPDLLSPNTFNNVTVDSKGRVISGSLVPLNFQPSNIHLANLADGFDDPGIIVWDGSQFINRLVEGTANEISIADGDGEFSNIKVGLSDNLILPGAGSVTIPSGTTTQRPGSPANGMIRFNTTTEKYEVQLNGNWIDVVLDGTIDDFLPLLGGTMDGDINMNSNNIVFTSGLVDGRDVSVDGQVLDNINQGTGVKVQTAPDTFKNREIEALPNEGLYITDGDGVNGNPSIGLDIGNIPNSGLVPNYNSDMMIYYDSTDGTTKATKVGKINRRQAFRYFMSQL